MRKILLFFAFVLTVPAAVFAQGVTTSSLSGSIKDASNAAIPGANIVAVHEPSGTTFGTSSLADGKFNIPNMRVGGPYKITITFVGYGTQTYGDVFLKLGEPYNLSVSLKEEGTELSEIVVLGSQDRVMNSERNGAITNIGTREIQTLPTITRSINDMTRLTPQATSTNQGAIGGGNYRQNYITVDGADFNNTFGIGTNLPANGSPISLDALEEISVNVTPFDIRQSGFIGSSINAVTRSGTNNFSGSAYTFWRTDKQQGNKVGDNKFTKQSLQDNTYGFRLGGPIIKNKLFFFVNAEKGERTSPGQQNFAATVENPFDPAVNPNISRPTVDELDEISQYLQENYQYATGPYQGYDFVSENTRLVGRLDWNINNDHRLSVRYSQVESKSPSFVSGSRSPLTNYAGTTGRTNNNALWFRNSNYFQEANFYSLAIELNSSLFGGRVANTLRGTYTHQNDPRSTDSRVFPFVDILDGSGGSPGVPFTSFGYEPFSFGNLRDVKTYSVIDNITWSSGIHNFTAGFQMDFSATKNGFQRFGSSYYTFRSWDDFVNGEKPVDFALTYSLMPGGGQAYPRFKFAQYSLYGQDEMSISDKLKVTVGLRLEIPTYRDVAEVQTHPLVAQLAFENGKTIDTGLLPDPKVMFSPRVGFNWDIKGDRSIQLRGGTGVFTSRVPTVWIVAQSGDAGLLQFTQTYQTPAADRGNPANFVTPGPFNADPTYYIPGNAGNPGTPAVPGSAIPSSVSATDPDFKFPQTWKTSIALDAKLPWGMIGTLEAIVNRDFNTAIGTNPNLVTPEALNVEGYPDNRPIYPNANKDKFINSLTSAGLVVKDGAGANTGTGAFNPILLSNGKKGYYWSITAKLDKQFSKGFFGSIAYTYSAAKNLYDGSGDQLINTWSGTQITGQANSPGLSYANYIVPSRIVGSVSYRIEYLKHLASTFTLFYEGSIYGRYSYTYSSDFNRDGQTNDLIYIPRDASEITFTDFNYGTTANPNVLTAQQQSDLFFDYIEQDDYLKSRKGQYAERNGAKFPWRSQFDFRFAQDVFVNIGGKRNSLQFTVDIFNLGNLLNKDWGIVKTVNLSNILTPTNVSSLTPGGATKPTFRMNAIGGSTPPTSTYRDNNSLTSTYYMQFGLRYTFN